MGGIIKGLLSEVIAGDQQAVPVRIEQGESEHAAELGEHGVAELLVEMHEHFGIGVGAKFVTAGNQFAGATRDSCKSRR